MPAEHFADCQDVAAYYRAHYKTHNINVASLWEAESFAKTRGEAATIRRAKAFNSVLGRSFLLHCPGDLFVGTGNLARLASHDYASDETLNASRQIVGQIGRRPFCAFADHHAPGYAKLLELGIAGLHNQIDEFYDRQDAEGQLFLDSVRLTLEGAERYFLRWASHLVSEASEFPELLQEQSEMMRRLASQPPCTCHEALQLVLSFHHMCQLDQRGAMAFGRLDQYLYPFYLDDKRHNRLDDGMMLDLLLHFFANITIDGDVHNIALAGIRPEDGEDATNVLSYMILEACKQIGRHGGNCSARIDVDKTPPAFIRKCAEVIRTGIGYPAVMNDQLTIRTLTDHGYPIEDARDYCFVGCIETFLPGKQAPWADARHNALQVMHEAVQWLAENEGSIKNADMFEAFYQQFLSLVSDMTAKMLAQDSKDQALYQDQAMDFTSPFMSALVRGCVEHGRDMNDGGAQYPANKGYGVMGVASIADSLAAVKKLVCEERRFTARQLLLMLETDFEGHEPERKELLNAAPKFGNGDNDVDQLAARFVTDLAEVFSRFRNSQGGYYWMLLASNVNNIEGGRAIGATPDGRKAGEPLSDASSPYFGRDKNGPTAVIRSISRLPYRLCPGGNVVNMKLDPKSIAGDEGLDALANLILTCFRLGGSELQFNTTDRETLIAAMEKPELYENLVVRVSGFSYNYTWLDRAVQRDILARTEHGA